MLVLVSLASSVARSCAGWPDALVYRSRSTNSQYPSEVWALERRICPRFWSQVFCGIPIRKEAGLVSQDPYCSCCWNHNRFDPIRITSAVTTTSARTTTTTTTTFASAASSSSTTATAPASANATSLATARLPLLLLLLRLQLQCDFYNRFYCLYCFFCCELLLCKTERQKHILQKQR